MKAKFYFFLSWVLVLVGCTPGLSSEQILSNKRDVMVGQSRPTAYIDGYLDGCSTGRRMAGDKKFSYKRNNVRADKDALYARGWQDGQINCQNETLSEQQAAAESGGFFSGSVEEQRKVRMEEESKRASTEVQEIWEELRK